jgi:hypothetical protein
MPDEPKKQPESQALQLQSAEFQTIYTNHIQSTFSALDVSLLLGRVAAIQNQWALESLARVIMSPTEAKILLNIMTNTIKSYEARFGVISVPPEVAVPLT